MQQGALWPTMGCPCLSAWWTPTRLKCKIKTEFYFFPLKPYILPSVHWCSSWLLINSTTRFSSHPGLKPPHFLLLRPIRQLSQSTNNPFFSVLQLPFFFPSLLPHLSLGHITSSVPNELPGETVSTSQPGVQELDDTTDANKEDSHFLVPLGEAGQWGRGQQGGRRRTLLFFRTEVSITSCQHRKMKTQGSG